MTLGLAELLDLPRPDVTLHVSWLRYALLVLAVAWAVVVARCGRWIALVGGVVFVWAVLAFWALALPRPYGLLTDDVSTRRLAALSVATATGTGDAGPLTGEPLAAGDRLFVRLGSLDGLLGPTVLPFLVMGLLALAVHLLGDPAGSGVPAVLWLAFSTGDPDTLRGLGLVPGLFGHPVESLALVLVVAGVLALGRLPVKRSVGAVLGLAVVLASGFLPAQAVPVAARDLPWILTLDQGPWIVLGLWGLARGAPTAALGLVPGERLSWPQRPPAPPSIPGGATPSIAWACCWPRPVRSSRRPTAWDGRSATGHGRVRWQRGRWRYASGSRRWS